MGFDLEDYVFSMADHELAVAEYLDGFGRYGWGLDQARGTIRFTRDRSLPLGYRMRGPVFAEWPVQLIGVYAPDQQSWRWAWDYGDSAMCEPIVAGIKAVRDDAAKDGEESFCAPGKMTGVDRRYAAELSTISAARMGGYSTWMCPLAGGELVMAIMGCPAVERRCVDPVLAPIRTANMISKTIALLEFDHRRALLAYVGTPMRTDNVHTVSFPAGAGHVRVEFDQQGRIAHVNVMAQPAGSAELNGAEDGIEANAGGEEAQ